MKNKIVIGIIFLIANVYGALAQNDNDLNISVVVPMQMEHLTSSQISKIESKMLKMVSNYGITGEGYTDKFIMYPKYEIYDQNIVEGLQNVHVIDVELNFIVKEVKTGKVYGVHSQEITGDGYSKRRAVDQSITKMTIEGDEIEDFLRSTKAKILDYYRSNCNRLYDEASTMVAQKRYNEAIAHLYPVPKEVGSSCYNKIQEKLDEAYLGYMNETCEKNLVRAKSEMSKNNNKTALEILGSIDSESNCHKRAQGLKAKLEVKTKKTSNGATTESTEVKTTVKVKKKEKIKLIAKAEFKRTRHQGEIDKAMEDI